MKPRLSHRRKIRLLLCIFLLTITTGRAYAQETTRAERPPAAPTRSATPAAAASPQANTVAAGTAGAPKASTAARVPTAPAPNIQAPVDNDQQLVRTAQ